MLFLFGFMLFMGAVDSLNPFTIAVHILLLGILKNVNRISIYISGILIVYLVGGIAIFTGFSAVSDFLVEQFELIPDFVLYGIEGLLGIVLAIYGILEWRKNSEKKQVSKSLDVSTWALIVLGAGGTLTDLPTAIPYLGFIAKMTEMRIDIITGILFLIGYCFIYTFPLTLIWILYLKFQDRIKDKMELIVKRIENANKYIMVIFSEIIGFGFFLDSVLFFLGVPIQW
jgi:cytochrome c biogenesis protein CcdA